jgi:ankyrin repeat protein
VLKDYDNSCVINRPNCKGDTALIIACRQKLPEAVEILIEAGADPACSNTNLLPIHIAVNNGDLR